MQCFFFKKYNNLIVSLFYKNYLFKLHKLWRIDNSKKKLAHILLEHTIFQYLKIINK